MDITFGHGEGATPLDPDEAEDLLPTHLETLSDLNAWEQTNILEAENWVFRRKRANLLTEAFVKELHRRMFNRTWRWAGRYRRSDKTIGVAWYHVPTQVRETCLSAQFWLEGGTFGLDELAVRFHHRLVWVHPFPNGNGRHARLMADVLLVQNGARRFSWGTVDLQVADIARNEYLQAIRQADNEDFARMIRFARS